MPGGNTSIAARRYAEAVFELAEESGTLAQWHTDLQTLADVAGDPEVIAILENPKTPQESRLALLDRALDGMTPLARNLARLLLTRNRLTLLPRIAELVQERDDQRRGVVRARVTTAVPLSDEDQQAIAERLRTMIGANAVRVETAVDPAIIGGLVARVGDRLIDGSTRARLIQLKKSLAGGAR
jgi:F-type H+-transporting ATPase subunit delta